MAKSNFVAYILWLFFGCLGVHHFYLHRTYQGVIWLSTFGGFTFGWFADIFRIPEYVAVANEDEGYLERLVIEMRHSAKPPFCANIFRILWLILVGVIFRSFAYEILPEELPQIFYILLIPIGNCIGFFLVMNTGRFSCQLKHCVFTAYIGQFVEFWLTQNTTHPGLFSLYLPAVLLFIFYRKWNKQPNRKGVMYKTKWFVGTCAVLSAVLVGGAYFHARIEIDGESIYLRDGIRNFMDSPAWAELKSIANEFISDLMDEGWKNATNSFMEKADFDGESHALEVMGLEKGCSIAEIRKRFRELSKDWHPDIHHGPDKAAAQNRFIEIEKAKETLLKITSRREGRRTKGQH